ncbi:hypothetical protein FNO01nite_12500 [Flavobacterium noncentrifugens]|nr:hypothetical protein FNO01nite_12500 [Flavobacterium noncentrifugens]
MGYSQTSIAIVGADVGGWPDAANPVPDTHVMTTTDGIHWTLDAIEIIPVAVDGGLKFRADNAWTLNWGSDAFPTGIAVLNGPNIHGVGAIYSVTFNSVTGEFHFEGPPVPVVKIIGAAVESADGIAMTTSDAVNYTASNVTLLTGGAQFNIAVDAENVSYGGTTFPEGEATDEGVTIPVVAGTYTTVTYNINDGVYVFTAAPVYPSIALVGSGAGGWPVDPQIDANVLTTADGETYTGVVTLTAVDPAIDGSGEIKFRSNNDWNQPNWGGGSFPAGPTVPADNIFVTTAGTYDVVFTRSTGAYTFSMASFAIVGDGAGGWPNDPQIDANQMTTTDGANYTLASVTLTDGPIKFRANNAWTMNFGGTAFPSGTGVANSNDNIPATAGTYSVSLNRLTGAYSFATLATANFDKAAFKAYPNPTHNNWNFDSAKENIETIQIVDVLGKTVLNIAPNAASASVDASALNNGVYFARIATATGSKTVKVVKN